MRNPMRNLLEVWTSKFAAFTFRSLLWTNILIYNPVVSLTSSGQISLPLEDDLPERLAMV